MKLYPIYGEQVLNLGSLPDALTSQLGLRVDPDNDAHLRHVITKVIKPYFERWDDDSKRELQWTLAVVLVDDDTDWMIDAWEADLPPFDLPDPPRHFFELLYEELFGDTAFEGVVRSLKNLDIDDDPTACNRMRVAPSDEPDIPDDLLPLPPG